MGLELPNMDALPADELRELDRVLRKAADYANYKFLAYYARLAGEIDKALRYEAKCERLYGELPKDVRW